jgi:hypothetical protein
MRKIIITLFSLLLAFTAFFLILYPILKKPEQRPAVNNFRECAAAGYPILENYPRQCKDTTGTTYIEPIMDSRP